MYGLPQGAGVEDYIRQAAQQRGIDPEVAIRVARSEGAGGWQSSVVKNGVREPSYGPFQLYTGGGLGNSFQQTTGLDPSNPQNWQQSVDYALDQAKEGGWGPWYGAKAVGITGKMGIDGNAAPAMRQAMASNDSGGSQMTPNVFQTVFQGNPEAEQDSSILPGGLGALFGRPNRNFDFGRSLQGAGAALASIGSPQTGAVLARLADREGVDAKNKFSTSYDPYSGQLFRINKQTGEVEVAGTGQRRGDLTAATKAAQVPDKAIGRVSESMDKFSEVHGTTVEAAEWLDKLESGQLNLGAIQNITNKLKNGIGLSDEESVLYAGWESFRNKMRNAALLLTKGVQTEGDAQRAMLEFFSAGASMDNKAAANSIRTIMERNQRAVVDRAGQMLQSHRDQYPGARAFDIYQKDMEDRKAWYDQNMARFKKKQNVAPVPQPTTPLPGMPLEQPKRPSATDFFQ